MSEDGTDLGRAALSGVRWIALSRIAAETSTLAAAVTLGRLVPPVAFGRAAIALVVVALAAIIGPAGLTAVLVQRREIPREHVQSAFFLALVLGIAMTALTVLFARTLGDSLFGSSTVTLLEIAAPAWLLAGVGAVPQALLQRELRFRRIALVDSLSVLVGAATAVVLAVAGVDAKAILANGLATLTAATLLAVVSARPPLPRPTRRGIRELAGFSSKVAFSSFVYSLFRNVDYAILGARVPAAVVGYYWWAYKFGVEYPSKISQIMLRVSFPVFSRATDLEQLRRMRMRIVRTHATVIVPLLAAFVAMAPVVIPWLLTAKWEPAVRPAQILAIAGMAYAIATGTGPLMIAVGRPGALLVWSVCELVLYAVLIFVLAPHGITTVVIGVAAFAVGSLFVIQIFLLGRYVGIPLRQLWDDVRAGIVVGAAVFGALTPVRMWLEGDVAVLALIVVLGILALAVYVAALRLLFDDAWTDLALIIRRVGGGRGSAAPA